MKKRLLVLAAGILQVPVIKRAHELGYFVIAADGNPDAVGFKYADKAICVDITSETIMLDIAKHEKIDGVIHPCSEASMMVMGRINDELHLSGVTREQAIVATNKHAMRKAFKENNAPSPISILVSSAEIAWDYFKCWGGDAVLKPTRNSGSRGIAKVSHDKETKQSFFEKYNLALEESRDHTVLLEEFIEGPEFSVEIIVWRGEINILTVTDKKTTGSPHFVELGHNQPSCFPDEIVGIVKDAAIRGVVALNVNNCACHAEIKIMHDKAYIMEIGARMGGDFISTILTKLSTGIDMVKAAIECALNIPPDLSPKNLPQGVCIRYFCPNSGRLISINNIDALNDAHVYDWNIYRKVGEIIPPVTSSTSRSGHIIVTAPMVHDAIELADKMIKTVEFITIK